MQIHSVHIEDTQEETVQLEYIHVSMACTALEHTSIQCTGIEEQVWDGQMQNNAQVGYTGRNCSKTCEIILRSNTYIHPNRTHSQLCAQLFHMCPVYHRCAP